MKESNEERYHRLTEEERTLSVEIEGLKDEMGIIEVNIILNDDDFRAQRDLKLSISALRSENILEKITSKMEEIEKKKEEMIELRDTLSEKLRTKLLEKTKVEKEMQHLLMKCPELCFRLCR